MADEQETLVPCHPRMMDLQQYGTHTACSVLQAQPAGWAWEVVFALLINLPLLGSQLLYTHTHTRHKTELTKLWRRVSLIGCWWHCQKETEKMNTGVIGSPGALIMLMFPGTINPQDNHFSAYPPSPMVTTKCCPLSSRSTTSEHDCNASW